MDVFAISSCGEMYCDCVCLHIASGLAYGIWLCEIVPGIRVLLNVNNLSVWTDFAHLFFCSLCCSWPTDYVRF